MKRLICDVILLFVGMPTLMAFVMACLPDRSIHPTTIQVSHADTPGAASPASDSASNPTGGGTTTQSPPPSNAIVFGEGDEFMTQVMGRARDFSWNYNLYMPGGLDLTIANGAANVKITEPGDPSFFPIYPGMNGCVNFESGENFPIDPTHYSRLALRGCTEANNFGQTLVFYFFRKGSDWTDNFIQYLDLPKGCGIYTVDMRQNSGWNGRVVGMRISPKMFKAGDSFSIDWIRLTAAPDPTNVHDIPWSNLGTAGGKLEFFLDIDKSGEDGVLIGSIDNAPASGTFTWGKDTKGILPQDLQVGTYWIHAKRNGQSVGYLEKPIYINGTPQLTFTSPSRASGQDYATSENGAPWDFTSEATTGSATNVDSGVFNNGIFEAMSTSGDPNFTFKTSKPIDTSIYRYLTFDFWTEDWYYSELSGNGGMSRIFWMTGYDAKIQTSIDIIINGPNQWLTWGFDLTTLPLIGDTLYPWTSDKWTILRFDPNENEQQYQFHWKLRNARLTAPSIVGPGFSINFTVADPEGAPVSVTLYRDNDGSGFDGTKIDTVTVTGSGKLPWTATGVPPGEWYIYGCVDDGFNHACRYADAPVIVK